MPPPDTALPMPELPLTAPAQSAPPLSALTVQPTAQAPLTPAQQRFNALVARIERLSGQIQALQAWSDRHRYAHIQALRASAQAAWVLQKNLLLFLHERLHNPVHAAELTAQQQRSARNKLRSLLPLLSASADPQVQALAELYAQPEDAQEQAQEQAQAALRLRAQIEAAMGQPLDNPSQYQTPEEMLAAGMRQWQRHQHAADERKAAKRAARKAQKKPAAHQQAQLQQADAKSALRTVYRQLASALHPDREPDDAERLRKTALMSEVNAAYEKNDLTTLLRLQVQVTQLSWAAGAQGAAGAVGMARLADDKLQAMALLLQEQVAALEDDLAQLQAQLTRELCVPVQAGSDEEALTRSLQAIQAEQGHAVDRLEADWRRIQRLEEFKRWLKEQAALAKEVARSGD